MDNQNSRNQNERQGQQNNNQDNGFFESIGQGFENLMDTVTGNDNQRNNQKNDQNRDNQDR
ncbi:hypothetical protein WQ57_19525 [Mesobacillus campisalis]|uniref:Uncharacterized protein n=1 Tax=Mesobacillus campisalis TaxID=1408103 RepID=A0A0M2SQ65_9BACI|nr:hypothetical protein [Mesobacillus campisalis]KKK36373.1 hypothetical protein WQ57_19525 [Mesobacillus campisalis]